MSFFDTLLGSNLSPDELARALAYTGAFEAAPIIHGDGTAQIEPDQNTVPWAMPGERATQHLGHHLAQDLAKRWDTLSQNWPHGPARLLWNPNVPADQIEQVTQHVWPALAACHLYNSAAPIIFMIAMQGNGFKFEWSWPPRYKLPLPAQNGLRDGMLERQLARLADDATPVRISDYQLFSGGLPFPPGPNDFDSPLWTPGLGMSLLPEESGQSSLRDLFMRLSDAHRTLGRPVAAIPIPESFGSDLIRDLSYELTHNLAPDVALAQHLANRHSGLVMPHPLVVIGAPNQVPFELDGARAQTQIGRLLGLLEGVPHTSRIPDEVLDPSILYQPVPATVGGLRAALRQVMGNPQDFFHHESDAASDIGPLQRVVQDLIQPPRPQVIGEPRSRLSVNTFEARRDTTGLNLESTGPIIPAPAPVSASRETTSTQAEPTPEAERFLDVSIYRGDGHDTAALPKDAVFESFAKYAVGVAIRAQRQGLEQDNTAIGLTPTRQDTETVTIWAILSTPTPDLVEIPDPIAQIAWPYDTDTPEIYVPIALKDNSAQTAEVEIRIYGASLEFLDQIHLRGIGIGKPSDLKLVRMDPLPAALSPRDLGQQVHLQLHEDTGAAGSRITMMAFAASGGQKIKLLQRNVLMDDARSLLDQTRTAVEQLAKGLLETRDGVSPATLNKKLLPDLAKLGSRAWTQLFGPSDSGISTFLKDLDRTPGRRIQVTTSEAAGAFAFPWAFMRPPLEFRETPNWDAFWGLRHQVEIWPGSFRSTGLETVPVVIATAEDTQFQEVTAHRKALKAQAGTAGITFEPAVTSGEALFARLNHDPAHLYYFFCHGIAPSVATLPRLVRDSLDDAGLIHADVVLEASVAFSGGVLTESEFGQIAPYKGHRPVFFLNLCQSAEIAAGQSSGLVRTLLNRGASCVLGTEAEMTAVFASQFAEDVFEQVFAGQSLGQAVVLARLAGIKRGNPLGLAYSLYGRGDMRLGPQV